jgi:hypothetical protein
MDYNDYAGAPLYTPEQQWVYTYQDVVQMDAGCVAAHTTTNDTWRCFFAEANLPYITTPLFVTQDLVDSWQMSNVLRIPCNLRATTGPTVCNSTELAAISAFRASMLAAYKPLLTSPVNGGYLSACYQHCHQNIDGVWEQELVSNATVRDLFHRWFTGAGGERVVVDGEFGSNSHCLGSPYVGFCDAAARGA